MCPAQKHKKRVCHSSLNFLQFLSISRSQLLFKRKKIIIHKKKLNTVYSTHFSMKHSVVNKVSIHNVRLLLKVIAAFVEDIQCVKQSFSRQVRKKHGVHIFFMDLVIFFLYHI